MITKSWKILSAGSFFCWPSVSHKEDVTDGNCTKMTIWGAPMIVGFPTTAQLQQKHQKHQQQQQPFGRKYRWDAVSGQTKVRNDRRRMTNKQNQKNKKETKMRTRNDAHKSKRKYKKFDHGNLSKRNAQGWLIWVMLEEGIMKRQFRQCRCRRLPHHIHPGHVLKEDYRLGHSARKKTTTTCRP